MRVNAFIKAFALGVVGIALLAFPLMSAQEHPTAASKVEVSKKDTVDGKTGKNWTLYNGDYPGQRYSSLSSVNTTNVPRLRATRIFHAENSSKLKVTPVV